MILHPVCSFTMQHGLMHPFITWSQYVPDTLDITKFVIYRSLGGMTMDETYVMIGKTTTNFYVDTSLELSRMQPTGYKIGWEDSDGNISSVANSEPVRWNQAYEQVTTGKAYDGNTDAMFYTNMEHIREFGWLQRNFGEDAWIYVKNIVGDLCPNYDPKTKECAESNCAFCYKTNIVPAYTVYKTQIPFQTANDQLDQSPWGLRIMSTTNFRIGIYPWIKNNDFIRRQTGDLGIISDLKRDYWVTEQSGIWTIVDKWLIEQEIPLNTAIDLTLPALDQPLTNFS